MRSRIILFAALPCLLVAGTPAHATEDHFNFGATERTSAAFAGFQFRMNIGDHRPVAPTARFQLGMNYYGGNAAGGYRLERHGSALEFGLSNRGRADLYVGGQRLTDIQKRMGIAPVAVAALAVGAVAVGAVAVSELTKNEAKCLAIGVCPP